MSMGNFLKVEEVVITEMAVKNDTVGVDHPTTVPANFDPEAEACPDCGELLCDC